MQHNSLRSFIARWNNPDRMQVVLHSRYSMRLLHYSLLGLIFSVFSCRASFNYIDPEELNSAISGKSTATTAKKLINMYCGYPMDEFSGQLNITVTPLTNGIIKAKLIHDNLQDDSQKAVKIVIRAYRANQIWTVLEIRQYIKCWKGRGHSNWSAALCY